MLMQSVNTHKNVLWSDIYIYVHLLQLFVVGAMKTPFCEYERCAKV